MKFECLDMGFLGCMLLVLWVSNLLVVEKIMGFVGFRSGCMLFGFMGSNLFKTRFFFFLIKDLGFLECLFFPIVWLLRKLD